MCDWAFKWSGWAPGPGCAGRKVFEQDRTHAQRGFRPDGRSLVNGGTHPQICGFTNLNGTTKHNLSAQRGEIVDAIVVS